MWTIITAAAGALVGLILMRNLATLRYRRPDERELPAPPHAWWLIPALAVVWGWLTWRHQEQLWPVVVLWLPLAAALGWLSAVDLDVRRLPDVVVLPAAGWVTAILAAHAITTDSPTPAFLTAAIGARSRRRSVDPPSGVPRRLRIRRRQTRRRTQCSRRTGKSRARAARPVRFVSRGHRRVTGHTATRVRVRAQPGGRLHPRGRLDPSLMRLIRSRAFSFKPLRCRMAWGESASFEFLRDS